MESKNEHLKSLINIDKVKIFCDSIDRRKSLSYYDPFSVEGIKQIIDKGCRDILRENTRFTRIYEELDMFWDSENCACNGFKSHSHARYNSRDIYPFKFYPDKKKYDYDDIESCVISVAPCFFFSNKCYACISETYAFILWSLNDGDIFKHTCGYKSFDDRADNCRNFADCGCNGKWAK